MCVPRLAYKKYFIERDGENRPADHTLRIFVIPIRMPSISVVCRVKVPHRSLVYYQWIIVYLFLSIHYSLAYSLASRSPLLRYWIASISSEHTLWKKINIQTISLYLFNTCLISQNIESISNIDMPATTNYEMCIAVRNWGTGNCLGLNDIMYVPRFRSLRIHIHRKSPPFAQYILKTCSNK